MFVLQYIKPGCHSLSKFPYILFDLSYQYWCLVKCWLWFCYFSYVYLYVFVFGYQILCPSKNNSYGFIRHIMPQEYRHASVPWYDNDNPVSKHTDVFPSQNGSKSKICIICVNNNLVVHMCGNFYTWCAKQYMIHTLKKVECVLPINVIIPLKSSSLPSLQTFKA